MAKPIYLWYVTDASGTGATFRAATAREAESKARKWYRVWPLGTVLNVRQYSKKAVA